MPRTSPSRKLLAVVLASIAIVAVVNRVTADTPEPDRTEEARQHAESLARMWAAFDSEAPPCPTGNGAFAKPGSNIRRDLWGHDMKMVCGKALPHGRRVLVVSAGPDGIFETGDDIRSDF